MCTKKLEYENYHLFLEKGGVQINRVNKLLEILRYFLSFSCNLLVGGSIRCPYTMELIEHQYEL